MCCVNGGVAADYAVEGGGVAHFDFCNDTLDGLMGCGGIWEGGGGVGVRGLWNGEDGGLIHREICCIVHC